MPKNLRAFSLIELSIVILIVSILLTGALSATMFSVNKSKLHLTQERMQSVYKAMGIFLSKNGYLPCPAAITLNKSSSSYGTAAATCTSAAGSASGYWKSTNAASPNLFFGMVPTKTLGLSSEFSEDGFGGKIGYFILSGFTSATNFGKGPASVASSKNYANDSTISRIIIKEKPTSELQITNDAAFVLISYGTNKSAGWNINSPTQNTASADAQEIENSLSNLDGTAGSADFDNVLFISSANSDNFDDIIFYKTRDEMTLDFSLLSLVSCDEASPTQTINYGGTDYGFTWAASSSTKYGAAAAANQLCAAGYTAGVARPTKKCGAFGKWESDVTENCLQNP